MVSDSTEDGKRIEDYPYRATTWSYRRHSMYERSADFEVIEIDDDDNQ